MNEVRAKQILWQAGQASDVLSYQIKQSWLEGYQDAHAGFPSRISGIIDVQSTAYLQGYSQGAKERT